MPKRKRLGADARLRLLYAHAYRCAGCDQLLPPTVEIDHITPLCSWLWKFTTVDPNHLGNLQPLCPGCHALKSQSERMRRPVGSAVKCQCGHTHSTYFKPQCKVALGILRSLHERCHGD